MSETDIASQIADLRALVEDLSARVEHLETELSRNREQEEISEEVMLALSAAVAAYLGTRATIRHVRFASRSDTAWATQGRSRIQQSHVIRPGL